jgi:hypothetical protein
MRISHSLAIYSYLKESRRSSQNLLLEETFVSVWNAFTPECTAAFQWDLAVENLNFMFSVYMCSLQETLPTGVVISTDLIMVIY